MNNNTLFDEQLFDDARLELENFLNELVKECSIEGKVNPIVGCKTRRKKITSIILIILKLFIPPLSLFLEVYYHHL